MKVGLIVYSETGHTLSVANELKAALVQKRHDVVLDMITVKNVKTDKSLVNLPLLEGYDVIIFATPVQGFSLPLPVLEYLKRSKLPKKQRIGVLMTQYFKFAWLGGNHTMKQLLGAVAYANPDLYGYGDVHWSCKRRSEQIVAVVRKLSDIEV